MPTRLACDPLALAQLCACLQGRVEARYDWEAVVALANRTLTTPALADALLPHKARLPADLAGFLQEISARTRQRNRMLHAQLRELVEAFAKRGLRPLPMKGTALLARHGPDYAGRIFVDLDLLVGPQDEAAARAALAELGYADLDRDYPRHDQCSFARDSDAAGVDLHLVHHVDLQGLHYDALLAHCQPCDLGGVTVQLPDAERQAAMLVVHDQLQEWDYWRGLADLRHLIDMRNCALEFGEAGWSTLEAIFCEPLARRALLAQSVSLAHLLGSPVPLQPGSDPPALAQVQRRTRPTRSHWMRTMQTLLAAWRDPIPGFAPIARPEAFARDMQRLLRTTDPRKVWLE